MNFSFEFFSLRRDSLRTRLMAWNMLTLAVILTVMGGLIQYTAQRGLLNSIDREIENNRPPMRHLDRDTPAAIRIALLPPDDHPGPNGHGPHGRDHGPPDEQQNGQTDDPGPPNGEQNGGAAGNQNSPDDSANAGERAAAPTVDWHRARIFDPQGGRISQKDNDPPADPAAFRKALAGQAVFADGTFYNEPARLLYTPIRFQGRIVAVTQDAHSMIEVQRAISGMRRALLTLIPVALLLAGIGGAWLTDRALRPVRQITLAAERIGADDLSRRLPTQGDDEFARLAGTFNGMLSRLESDFAQREALVRQLQELIAQQQRFTGDASHELRTPLTIIKANASLLLPAQPTSAEWREGVEEINSAADSMTRLVQDLLLLTRADGGQMGRAPEILPLDRVLEKAVSRVRRPDAAEIRLEIADAPLSVRGDAEDFTRLFCNLIENAQRHTPSTGTIQIKAARRGAEIIAQVIDNGAGIAPEHLPHLCERFYRVDSARSRPDGGTGLGLAICKSIAESSGGTLSFASAVGKGTTVTVTLPAGEKGERYKV